MSKKKKQREELERQKQLRNDYTNPGEYQILKKKTIKELIAPSGLDASNIDHLEIISNVTRYARSFFVSGLPRMATFPELFRDMYLFGDINTSIYIEPVPESRSQNELNRVINELETERIVAADRGNINRESTIGQKRYEAEQLRDEIAAGFNKLYEASIISTLFAYNLQDLDRLTKLLAQTSIKLARENHLIPEDKYNFLWVTDFPMFEFSEEENRYVAAHHPFTSPRKEDMDKLLTDKANCYSRAYDLVLNGYELLSGSVRIHDSETQAKVFEAIDMTQQEAEEKFGFFLEAFKYGAPPHCGVGIGLERLIMILAGTENIKEVVAFPKTATAQDLMNSAPGIVSEKQLNELGLKIK